MDDDQIIGEPTRGSIRPVHDINVHLAGKRYTYEPAMARPIDMPYLLQLMVALLSNPHLGPFDVEGFVNEHNLWHCFKERA